jgi:beta-glucosidase
MYKLICFTLILSIVACSPSDLANPVGDDDDAFVNKWLSQMTLKEKIGQMTQLNIDVISVGEVYQLEEPHRIDTQKLRKAIVDYGVGSILNVGGHAYSLSHFQEYIGLIQKVALEESRLKIPVLYGIDAIHGANYLLEGTMFPQPLAQAATFNPTLVKKAAAITAYETKASGITWNFSPVLDVARQPLWSRVFETYGEDVLVCKTMGTTAVKGYQGVDPSDPYSLGSCMKHFMGYSMPFTGKDRTTVYLHERQWREYFLPSFEAAIKAGSLSVMINSGDINGIPVHADKQLLTELLRNELGFKGVAVTDWEDIMKLQHPHRVAHSLKEAVKLAINAGIDMSMVPNDYRFSDILLELVEEGSVPMSRIDEAVFRILMMKKKLGLFDTPLPFDTFSYPLVGSDSFTHQSYLTALESITLLKNDHQVLPLATNQKIWVTGPMAHTLNGVNGAWSRTWQGVDTQWNNPQKSTILQALSMDNPHVFYHPYNKHATAEPLPWVKQKLRTSEVIVAVMGEEPSTEKPGDINSLSMDDQQISFVKELHKSGKPIILVLVQNRMRLINEIAHLCDAIVLAYQPSENGTKALADILFGKANPSGKLPVTYPKFEHQLLTYDHKFTDVLDVDFSENAFNPQFEFGHGLSYSSFKYGTIVLHKDTFQMNEDIEMEIQVENKSSIGGKETVLVFISDDIASITPPVKRLRAFDKKYIPAYSTVTYSFRISIQELAFVGIDNQWTIEKGNVILRIGNQTKNIYLQ